MKLTRLFLLFGLLAVPLAWTQADTPIVISDGSLTIESRGGPAWSQFTGSGGMRNHPNAGKTVTSVDLTVNGRNQTISFSGQQCTVTVQYGGTTIAVSTGPNGRGLRVSTDFSAFHGGANGRILAHNDPNQHMSTISVQKAGANAFNGTGSGHSVITIHYQ